MFSRRTDGSKVALVFLVDHLRRRGFTLFDIQFLTEHTARLGAIEIPRKQYLSRLQRAIAAHVEFA
jgi:leucyl/phenylalanyl-tRNA--protein transferase